MRFHALLPVRDEADIIGQCLDRLLTWADGIWVFDTGSVDDTWEIVQEMAHRDSRIKPLRRDPVYYNEPMLRGWIFEQARREMQTGDWFARVDADEFHHILPPDFVKHHLKPHETVVWHQYFNFQLRACEAADWEAGRETVADRARPIEERRQYYTVSDYSEPRLCRYRETMKWSPGGSFPVNAGYRATERLPIRHYPHRDPAQLHRRCTLRAIMMADQKNRKAWREAHLHHWVVDDWRKFVTPDNDPALKHWQPGSELPDPGLTSHLLPWKKRVILRAVHGLMLPYLDARRPAFVGYPLPIPEEVTETLRRELAKAGAAYGAAQAS